MKGAEDKTKSAKLHAFIEKYTWRFLSEKAFSAIRRALDSFRTRAPHLSLYDMMTLSQVMDHSLALAAAFVGESIALFPGRYITVANTKEVKKMRLQELQFIQTNVSEHPVTKKIIIRPGINVKVAPRDAYSQFYRTR